MGWLVALIAILALLVALTTVLKEKAGKEERVGTDGPPPFRRSDSLLTKGEAAFFHVLRQAVEAEAGRRVFAKVRLIDLLWLPSGTKGRQGWNNRVMSKHIDFVVCETEGRLKPLLGVELDDSSHEREDRKERDEFVDQVCKQAGLQLVRVRASASYDVREIRALLSPNPHSGTNDSARATARRA